MYLIAFPLLIIPVALYNMIAFLLVMDFKTTVFSIPLLSGERMAVSTGELLVVFSILLLYVELLKATRLAGKAIIDHVLSVILFIAVTIEFMVVQVAATSTFLFLVTLCFVDAIGGLTISMRTAHRDVEGLERVQR